MSVIEKPAPGGGPARTPVRVEPHHSREDKLFRGASAAVGFGTVAVLVLIGVFLLVEALPAFRHMGWRFLTTPGFQPIASKGRPASFGVASALYGTTVIAAVALVVGVPISIFAALFITEYAPGRVRRVLTTLVDLLAAIPSVIFGLWGFWVMQPRLKGVAIFLSSHFSFIPIFKSSSSVFTSSLFIAGCVVGLMITPIVTSICREVFSLAPAGEREGALALGSTRAGVIRRVVLPFGKGGIIGGVLLGLGRALGETIAVVTILSLVPTISGHILQAGGNSISALIATHFSSGGKLGLAACLGAGLVLFFFTLIVNLAASTIVGRFAKVTRSA